MFLYYFLGLVVSRFGSLVIGPLLKSFSFIKFADYRAFIDASKKDTQIEVLSEANNSYRTLCALFSLLLLLKLYAKIHPPGRPGQSDQPEGRPPTLLAAQENGTG